MEATHTYADEGVDQEVSTGFEDWPRRGYDGPQPWEAEGPTDLEPGEPNTVSPIVLAHDKEILTSGSGGPAGQELGRLLHRLGYKTSISRGQNAFGIVDSEVMAAVRQFRADYGVAEDPSAWGSEDLADAHVGPWTWEALMRAVEREGEER